MESLGVVLLLEHFVHLGGELPCRLKSNTWFPVYSIIHPYPIGSMYAIYGNITINIPQMLDYFFKNPTPNCSQLLRLRSFQPWVFWFWSLTSSLGTSFWLSAANRVNSKPLMSPDVTWCHWWGSNFLLFQKSLLVSGSGLIDSNAPTRQAWGWGFPILVRVNSCVKSDVIPEWNFGQMFVA